MSVSIHFGFIAQPYHKGCSSSSGGADVILFMSVAKQNNSIATDVKVAPGGTENVDTDIYEAVVSQPIMEPQVGADASQ